MKLLRALFKNTESPVKVIGKVEEQIEMKSMYIFLLLIATILALFGVVTSNSFVIIGSMIISPLSWPIMGIAVGVASEKGGLALKSFISLMFSCLFVVGLSYLLSTGFLSSSISLNDEILSRIAPTLYDLIIALAVGLIAAVSLSWSKVSETIAGVAIAISLLPPLTVTGIGFALHNWEVVSGSFLLFFTNVVSIIFAGLILFFLQGYYRVTKEAHPGIVTLGFGVTIAVVFSLGVHLTFSLSTLIQDRAAVLQAESLLQNELSKISSQLIVDGSLIRKEHTASGTVMSIRASVTAPQNVYITYKEKNDLVSELSDVVHLPVDLDLRFVPSLQVLSDEVIAKDREQQVISQVENQVEKYFAVLDSVIGIDSVNVWIGNNDERSRVVVVIKAPEERTIGAEHTIRLQSLLSQILGKELDLEIQVLKTQKLTEQRMPTELERVKEYVEEKNKMLLERFSSAWQMDIKITSVQQQGNSYNISLLVYVANDINVQEKLQYYKESMLADFPVLKDAGLQFRFEIVKTSVYTP